MIPAAAAAAPTGLASARGETVLTYAAIMYRAYGLTQVVFVAVLGWAQHPGQSQLVWFSAVVAAESVAVMAACQLRHRIPAPLMTADLTFNVAALFLGAALSTERHGVALTDYMYTYTAITSVAVGFAYSRYLTVLALTSVLAAANYAAEAIFHHGTFGTLAPDSIGYFTNTAVAWIVARYLHLVNARLDHSHATALAHAGALASERERAQHARILHDRVLQTLETLARDSWLTDQGFRRHIAREAAWLRALIDGSSQQPGDLLAGLQQLVQDYALTGLHVEFTAAQLHDSTRWRAGLSDQASAALVDATREALTNIVKHAGVTAATMRAECAPGALTVSVLDHGSGFDQARTTHGMGLKESITRRISDAGGTVTIDSAPGAGTHIELTIPLRFDLRTARP